MTRTFKAWRDGKPFDREGWDRVITVLINPSKPHRYQIVTLQRMAEMALIVEEPSAAISTIRAATDYGLIDIVWLDNCPLFTELRDDPAFCAIRTEVAERASRVLSAFRAAGG